MSERLTLTNRFTLADPEGWVLLAPLGDHPHGEYIQRIDGQVISALVNRWAADGSRDIPIDFDHRTHVRDDDTEAAGWIKELQARADGLYGRVQWSDAGESALLGGRYRLLSPTWDAQVVDTADHGRTKVVHPTVLRDAALTNEPNIKALPFLTNRAPRTNAIFMKEILKALGLGESATEAEAAAKIAELQGSVTSLQNRCAALKTETEQLRTAQVEADLEAYADVIDDKDSAKELLMSNRAAAVKLFVAARARVPASEAVKSMTNRPTKQPATGADKADPDVERYDLVETIRLRNRCSFEAAWSLARREKPELFTPATE